MDLQTLTVIACLALLVVVIALLLRNPGTGDGRELAQARTAAEVAGARMEAQALLLAERDARVATLAAEVEALRGSHRLVEIGRADAESRCAQATEAVSRLERAATDLREDGAKVAQQLREAETRCADAETRCAKANEGVARLERVEAELRKDLAELRQTLHQAREEQGTLQREHAALKADTDGKIASATREVESLKAIREEMTREFRDLANRTLRETGSEFSRAHEEKLNALLTPFKEQVNKFEVELRGVHEAAGRDRVALHEQIKTLTTQTQLVSQEAINLTRALKGDKQRQGAWGEAQLEQYLEHMGYVKGVHYTTQDSRTNESGDRLRPDVVLKLPGGRALIIDSKVSLVSYAAAIAAETEEERARHLREHVRAVKARIDELSARDYHDLDAGSVEWVLLFMPIEGAVSAAWAHEADIAAYAMERRIGIAYPTTLLMALRTVKHLWDIENRNANAEKIAQRGGLIYDKLASFIESFKSVEKALDSAKTAQVRALGQLSEGKGNLLSQVEHLKKLGAKTSKSLSLAFDADPEGDDAPPPAADDTARELPAAE